MQSEKIAKAAEVLRQSRATQVTIDKVSLTHGIASLEEAYLVSEINRQFRIDSGSRVVGKKIGLTSKAVQAQLGVDQPDFGFLFSDMEFLNGQTVPAGRLIQPKAEAEIAFVVQQNMVGQVPTYGEFLSCLGYALPAVEIVDSAIADWKITIIDTVADNASSGLYVLGDQPVPVAQLALGELGMSLKKNGALVSSGVGSACLGHPLRAAYWLASEMIRRGHGLAAGEVILSGALGSMVPIQTGDSIDAHIQGLGSVHFSLGQVGGVC